MTILEPARRVPVAHEADLCIVGGSCTGLFAAVRAARLGLRVALVEQHGVLGGMVTAAQVTHWHCTMDVFCERKIIGGLADEVVDRMRRRDAVVALPPPSRTQYKFNPAVLACELDALAVENGIRLFLSTRFSVPIVEDGRITAVVVEDKSGRRAIRAKVFIDASGDGDLVRRAGFPAIQHTPLQPAAYQVLAAGIQSLQASMPGVSVWDEVRTLAQKHGFPNSNPWLDVLPGVPGISNVFGARMNGVDASDPDQLTAALIEGRRISAAYLDMIRERFGDAAKDVALVAVAQALGVRETWHAVCRHRVTGDELLSGTRFDDAIANGIYPVDVHHPGGTLLRYLDGREDLVAPSGEHNWGRWRPEDEPTPACYHIPYRSLVPKGATNLLVAGRLIDADREAYGAIRVMVNCNQTGEAAGAAAALAVEGDLDVGDVPPQQLRAALAAGGSIVI